MPSKPVSDSPTKFVPKPEVRATTMRTVYLRRVKFSALHPLAALLVVVAIPV
jgi:hypothetical protein